MVFRCRSATRFGGRAQVCGLKPAATVLDRDAEGALVRKAGVMAVVLGGGEVLPGDAIAVELPPGPHRALAPV